MKFPAYTLVIISALLYNASALAKHGNQGDLPPGLQKKVAQGKPLPPGWQRKLAVGDTMQQETYRHGEVIHRDTRLGRVDIRIDGRVYRVLENTREILEIITGH